MPSGCVHWVIDARPPLCLPSRPRVERDQQGRGLSRIVIQAMAACADAAGFHQLVAPVRPNWKERHPLVPIDEYAGWVRDDGLPYDPWMRVHARLGATVIRPAPESFLIEAPRLRLGGVDGHQPPL